MKKSTSKNALKYALIIPAFFSGISVFATNCPKPSAFNDSVVVITDTVMLNPSKTEVRTTARVNPMEGIVKVLPEIFESFGYTEKRMNSDLRKMSHALSGKINRLNRYAKKKNFSNNPQMVKQLLKDMNIRIGGSQFATRPLSAEFVAKFTPGNIAQLAEAMKHIKLEYEDLAKQNGLGKKFDVLKNFKNTLMPLKNVELLKAFGKEYAAWITEITPGVKGITNIQTPKVTTQQIITDSVKVTVDTVYTDATLPNEGPTYVEGKTRKLTDREIFDRAYILKPEQVKISQTPYKGGNDLKLIKIDRGENETKVTIAIPIHFESNWISTDSAFYLMDKQTNDRYYPRRMENNIPLNKVIIVKNQTGKMIEITYVYPPLNKSVMLIDIVEDLANSTVEIPSNAAKAWKMQNVFVDEYTSHQQNGKIYR